jgi:sugar fermentation stimulation protein A
VSITLNLRRGKLLKRPNRFVFIGQLNGKELRLHCPATGSIGEIKDFCGLPCLISVPTNGTKKSPRTTSGTVEAFSLDGGKSWIGINQNRINGWVEQLLHLDALPELISCADTTILHEVRVEDSRLDLCVVRDSQRTFLEIKTPIRDLYLSANATNSSPPSPDYFARGLRHFETLARLVQSGHRAIVLICFLYNAVPFAPPPPAEWNRKIYDVVQRTRSCGVEHWQLNCTITPDELRVERLMRLNSLC